MASDTQDKKSKDDAEKPLPIKKTADLQRLKLEKLMKNIEKPVVIPERPKEKTITNVPEFVRNVMGSSAGAGSGEFHVYRHLRRKEYARQKFIQLKSEKEQLDEAYRSKLEENKRKAEERTAKKRAKRLKKKEKMKNKKKKLGNENKAKEKEQPSEDESDSDNESTEEGSANDKTENENSMDSAVNKTENENSVDFANENA